VNRDENIDRSMLVGSIRAKVRHGGGYCKKLPERAARDALIVCLENALKDARALQRLDGCAWPRKV
jgi:hypothetical protein